MNRLTAVSTVVTGAAKGIGAAIAARLCAEGAHVTVSDRDLSAAQAVCARLEAAGGTAIAVEMDVTDRTSVRTGLAHVRDRFGRVDVMVANAGISLSAPLFDTTADLWMRHQQVNGLGTLICMQEAARLMIEQGDGGKIIAVTSTACKRNSADFVAYAASKASTSSLIQDGARALAPHRITVTGIAPGIVETPLWSGIIEDDADRHERLAQYARLIPLGHVSVADDLVGAAAFLASADADYMTGQIVTVDGGITA